MEKLSDHLHIPTMGEIIRDRNAARLSKGHKRHYAGAKRTRLNADWTTHPTSANFEMRMDLQTLRARARQLARDNSHFKKYLSMVRSNVIGPEGIKLQSRARGMDGKTLNVELNKQVEDAFRQWGSRETCTMSGKLDWTGVQRLIVTQLARDGEFLVQKVTAKNDFGFSLKVISVDWLDEYFVTRLPNGNRVIMSVEVDDNERPVAYWLTTPWAETDFVTKPNTRTRVPAEEMIHGFLVYDDETQTRGVTWFAAPMVDAKNYQLYGQGVIQSARMASNSLGFLVQDTPDGDGEFNGEDDESGIAQVPQIDVSPLSMNALPQGWKLEQFDPKQPTQNHSAFAKTVGMDTATGLEVPYFALFGDMESVNFSSARVGLDEAREIWKIVQDFMASTFCRDVFRAWSRNAWLSGKLRINADEYLEIQNPTWRGRGWNYVDPVKDINADVIALENNLKTWTDVFAARGEDLVDYLERRQSEIALAKKYGIELVAVTSVTVKDTGAAPPANEGDDQPPADPKQPPKRYVN